MIVKFKATVDVHGYVISDFVCRQTLSVACIIFVYIHIGVGFGVARFDYQGDARASMCGTSDKHDSHAFLLSKSFCVTAGLPGIKSAL